MEFGNYLFNTNPGWDLIKGLIDFYGLKEYLKVKAIETITPEKITTIVRHNDKSEYFFWKKIFNQELRLGDYVKLINFDISSWFPRKPGQFWTIEADMARQRAIKYHVESNHNSIITFDKYGKNLMAELGGIGTVNFSKGRDLVLFTATSSGITHQGIPIISTQSVWEKLQEEINARRRIKTTLTGKIIEIPSAFNSYLYQSVNIPKLVLFLNSTRNVSVESSDIEIFVSPWTLYKSLDRHSPYGFAYTNSAQYSDELINSSKWLQEYIYSHNGKTILTDYDETSSRLNAVFPLSNTLNGVISDDTILDFCQKIRRDFEH